MTVATIRLHDPAPPAQFTPLERLRFLAWEDSPDLIARWLPLRLSPGAMPDHGEYWRPGARRFYWIDLWPARTDRWKGFLAWRETWNGGGTCARGDDMISLAARLAGCTYRQAAQNLARLLGAESVA